MTAEAVTFCEFLFESVMNALNDTIRSGAVIDYRAAVIPDEDLTPHMIRIIRRALRPGGG